MPKKNSASSAQKFAEKLISILKGKSHEDSHWELVIGFVFFFGGLYFLASYFTS